jgi:hypothetical protein
MGGKLEELTVAEARQAAAMFGGGCGAAPDNSAWEIGKAYLIRTVTMINTGRLVAVTAQELVLEDAAWIADTGRFSNALNSGDFSEIEPYPEGRVIIGRGAVVDAVQLTASLPRVQK